MTILFLALLLGCESHSSHPVLQERPIAGVSYKALAAFDPLQCDLALDVFHKVEHPAINVLFGTFGDPTLCLQRFTSRYGDHPHTVVVDLTNETCRRPERFCEKGAEVLPWYEVDEYNRRLEKRQEHIVQALRERMAAVNAMLSEVVNANTRVIINTGLENNFFKGAAIAHTEAVRPLTDLPLIFNPVDAVYARTQFVPPGVQFLQLHALNAEFPAGIPCSWSNDGTDIDFNDASELPAAKWAVVRDRARHYREHGCMVFLWWNTQGIVDPWVAPSQREFEVRAAHIAAVNAFLRE